MKNWQIIRQVRDDLTDYVVHFTRSSFVPPTLYQARDVLIQILRSGWINPTFAPMANRYKKVPQPTIRGPDPAVCLTEQPLSAVLKTPVTRYSHYGIAYHKVCLFDAGGRPVLYGSEQELGIRTWKGQPGYQEGKDIYTDGLPEHLQYLWVRYVPILPGRGEEYPIDFTWEREWRFKGPLKILLDTDWSRPPLGAIVVEKDTDVPVFSQLLDELSQSQPWALYLKQIVSLETAKRMLAAGDNRYARIETWPWS